MEEAVKNEGEGMKGWLQLSITHIGYKNIPVNIGGTPKVPDSGK